MVRLMSSAGAAILMSLITTRPVSAQHTFRIIVFAEPGFPAVDVGAPAPIPGASSSLSGSKTNR